MVADIAHLALRQRRMRAGPHRRTVLVVDHPAADQAADLVGRKIIAGESMARTPGIFSAPLRGIDRLERRMGMRRAHEIGVALARTVDVVGVAALAGDEALVFLAADTMRRFPSHVMVESSRECYVSDGCAITDMVHPGCRRRMMMCCRDHGGRTAIAILFGSLGGFAPLPPIAFGPGNQSP